MATPDIGRPVLDVYVGKDKDGIYEGSMHASPMSRGFVNVWAVLTWIITIGFAILVIIAFTQDVTDPDNGVVYRRADTFPRNMGVWNKERWSDWSTLVSLYKPTATSTISTMSTGNGSSVILDSVMKNLMCHGDVPNSALPGPLQGGIKGYTMGSDTILTSTFQFASEMCQCVYQQHMDVYANVSKTATTADLVAQLGDEFTQGIVGTTPFNIPKGQDLLRKCFFSTRTSYKLTLDKSFFLSVSPYMLVHHINAVAGIIAAMYLVTAQDNSHKKYAFGFSGFLKSMMNSKGAWLAAVLFGMVNLGLGLWALIVSSPGTGSLVLWTLFECALFAFVWFLSVFTMMEPDKSGVHANYNRYKDVFHKNIRVIQRVGFWIHYFFAAPALLLLHDALNQQRATSYVTSRFIFVLGICFMGAGTDMITLFYENFAKVSGTSSMGAVSSATVDGLRSTMWWSWATWTAAASALVYSSGTVVSMPYGVLDTMQGGPLFINVAFIFYMVGIPLVSIPGLAKMNTKHMSWSNDTDSAALSIRLAVDLAVRVLVTVSALFWLSKPRFASM